MFDGIESHASPRDRICAWVADSEYSIAERAVAWVAMAVMAALAIWCVPAWLASFFAFWRF